MTAPYLTELKANGICLTFDARTGLISSFTVEAAGAHISPLHRAPWVGTDETFPQDMPPHLRTLGGDFFCAPFAQEKDGAPPHGWPANSAWDIEGSGKNWLRARLRKRVNGAALVKEITLRDGHPFVYQTHTFIGGEGSLPVANHANVALPNGGIITTSPKAFWTTPPAPLESDPAMGRSGLRYPAQSTDPAAFPSQDGTTDLTRYPWFPRHEDFVVGVEAPGHRLGWTAVSRPTEGDLFLSLRRADVLPHTMLWHSNGGRDYPPWSGRHFGCLGVEEGMAPGLVKSQQGEGDAGNAGLALAPFAQVTVRHTIGAIVWPADRRVCRIRLNSNALHLEDETGRCRSIPICSESFA